MSNSDTEALDTTRNASDNTRPVTSKPRGACKYYNTSRGCYAGDGCKFLHGHSERLTPYDKSKTCKFYASGWCSRGDKCWFIHAEPTKPSVSSTAPSQDPEDEEQLCSICYDKPVSYGLLIGCSHVFCLPCIKNWRGSEGKSTDILEAGTTKTCPMCRTTSRYVTPSSLFFAEGDPRKAEAIEKYKQSMARIKCRYFERSSRKRFCPFGRDCFYKHENEDGTPYVFPYGVEYYMGPRRSRDDDYDIEFNSSWPPDASRLETMLTTIIDNANLGSGAMRRAILSSLAAVFGTDALPPIYSLDEESGQEEEEATPVPPSADQSEAEPAQADDVWDDWPANTVLISPPPEEIHTHSAADPVRSPSVSVHDLQGSSGATLDPTSPEFVPSFLLDNMRVLPPGPSRVHNRIEDPAVEGATGAPGESLWNVADLVRDWEERQRNTETLPATTSLTPAPEASSSSAPAQIESETQAALAVQDTDPPFMTDGRGRVVWSSTTISRGREGRRGRATSSSATIVPHPKSTPDLSAAEESSDEAPQHESPGGRSASASGRLVRQRSLPLVGYGYGADGGTHPAEFMTDGRGRVVFASTSSHSH